MLLDDPDNRYVMIDSTIVRAHQQAVCGKGGGQREALGCSRGGLSTQIHLLVDAQGRPVRFSLTGGQRADVSQAIPLLTGIETGAVIADRGMKATGYWPSSGTKERKRSYRPSQTGETLGNTTGNCIGSAT